MFARVFPGGGVLRRPTRWLVPVAAMVLGACASSGRPADGGASPATVALWSDGWKPGDPALAALATGPFHARVTGRTGCGWLGDGTQVFRWPAGWRVRLNPTTLLDPSGRVVGRDGDVLWVGGGNAATTKADGPCGAAGQEVWDVEGDVSSVEP